MQQTNTITVDCITYNTCNCFEPRNKMLKYGAKLHSAIQIICETQMRTVEKKAIDLCDISTILQDINKYGSGTYPIEQDFSFFKEINERFIRFQKEFPAPSYEDSFCSHGNSFCLKRAAKTLFEHLKNLPYIIIYDIDTDKFILDSNGVSDARVMLDYILPRFAQMYQDPNNKNRYPELFEKNLKHYNIEFEFHIETTGDETNANAKIDVLYAKTV